MKEMLTLIKNRRSVRQFKPEQVTEETLDAILEAGRYAPSGGNNQSTRFLVIQNPQALQRLRDIIQGALASMEIGPDTHPPLVHAIKAAKSGAFDFMYGAPTLIVTANKQGYQNAAADCACALENMMLAASAAAAGSCWINQPGIMGGHPGLRVYMEELGMEGDEAVFGALAVGYPAAAPGAPLERTGNPVVYIR